MADYIDRAKLGIGECNREIFENKSYADGWNAAIKILQEAPAADVQEVKRGEWEYIGTDKMGNVFRCSQCCGRIGLDKETDYCPNCGAKMDGDSGG